MMTTQKKKPLPAQPRTVEPLTRKAEAAAPPHPQLEVLQERMGHLATREEMHKLHGETMGGIEATRTEMHKLHGEAMGRIDATNAQMNKLHGETMERMNHLATKAEMYKLHGEAMGGIEATRTEMHKLHGEAMGKIEVTRVEMHKLHGEAMQRIGKVEGDLTFIKWTLSVFVAPLIIAMAAGILKLVFFP